MITKKELELSLKKCYEFCQLKSLQKKDFSEKFKVICDNRKKTFIIESYGEIFEYLMAYALYKELFHSELFSLEEYLDELLKVGSTFSNCGMTHVVLCKYTRENLKVKCTFVDYKNKPHVWDEIFDFSDYFKAAYELGNTSFYDKVDDKISEEDVLGVKNSCSKIISEMNEVIKALKLIK